MKKISFSVLLLLSISVNLAYGETYNFAVMCDTRSDAEKSGTNGVNISAVKAVCRDMAKNNAKFALAPGDLICGNASWYNPIPPTNDVQLQTFLYAAASQDVGLPGTNKSVTLYPVRGNHENYHDIVSKNDVMNAWSRNIGKKLPQNGPTGEVGFTYSFLYKDTLFIGIDEYIRDKDISVNQPWLDSQLKNNKEAKNVFVFGHTPAFTAHHSDCLEEKPLKRNAFLRSISSKNSIYFCGHDHFYARADVPVYSNYGKTIDGYIQQVITPSGAPFLTASRKDNKKWDGNYSNKDVIRETYIDNAVGYQLVTVYDDKITVQFIATQDSSSFNKDDEGVYHYTFNDNWEKWSFVVMDQFSIIRK